MKENKYDNQKFFEKYGQMLRSREGLKGAGEWPVLKKVLPDFKEKRVLDLGCGYGWHCFYAMEKGAKSVVGIDISEKMLKVANEKNTFSALSFLRMPIEDISFGGNSFDIVLSSLAFHYIKSFKSVVERIYDCLEKGGYFVFSVEHPVFTSQGCQQWFKNESGEISHFPVDNYFYEGERKSLFLEEEVIKYHKTITTYLNTLLEGGFELLHVLEPYPNEDMLKIQGMADEMRRPLMLIISARKK